MTFIKAWMFAAGSAIYFAWAFHAVVGCGVFCALATLIAIAEKFYRSGGDRR